MAPVSFDEPRYHMFVAKGNHELDNGNQRHPQTFIFPGFAGRGSSGAPRVPVAAALPAARSGLLRQARRALQLLHVLQGVPGEPTVGHRNDGFG